MSEAEVNDLVLIGNRTRQAWVHAEYVVRDAAAQRLEELARALRGRCQLSCQWVTNRGGKMRTAGCLEGSTEAHPRW